MPTSPDWPPSVGARSRVLCVWCDKPVWSGLIHRWCAEERDRAKAIVEALLD